MHITFECLVQDDIKVFKMISHDKEVVTKRNENILFMSWKMGQDGNCIYEVPQPYKELTSLLKDMNQNLIYVSTKAENACKFPLSPKH